MIFNDLLNLIDNDRDMKEPLIIAPDAEEANFIYTTSSNPLLEMFSDFIVIGIDPAVNPAGESCIRIWVTIREEEE